VHQELKGEHTMTESTAQLIALLQKEIAGEVKPDRLHREIYSTDASDFRKTPMAVVLPKSLEDLRAIVQIAGRHGGALIPRGGGSSLSGQAVGEGIILDHSKYFNRILEFSCEERFVWVESGVVLDRLNAFLAPHGLMVGPDPASSCVATLGGMSGNNSTGSHSIKYGLTVDHVQEMEVVLADGSVAKLRAQDGDAMDRLSRRDNLEGRIHRHVAHILDDYAHDIESGYPKTWRNVAGYNLNRLQIQQRSGSGINLASLIVGSEGTLATISRIKLGLVPRPRRVRLMVLHFPRLDSALERVPLILEHHPSAVELMTYPTLKLAHDHAVIGPRLRQFVQGIPGAVLIVEFTADSESELADHAGRLEHRLHKDLYAEPIAHCLDNEAIGRVWSIRKSLVGIMASKPREAKRSGIIDDATVPVDRLISFTREVIAAGKKHGIDINFDAHASAGCLHMCPDLNLKTPEGLKCLELLARDVATIAIAHQGTTTGEHGEGLARSYFNKQLYGERLHRAFGELKAAFDPRNLFNPQKIVDGRTPWDPQWLKYYPGYRVPHAPQQTYFDFSHYNGFAGLVEMCNGMGFCRGQIHGTMCPSFRVTGDELHSTRGRANTLRAALTGDLGPDGLASDDLYAALDLCLECKACKAECAARVDMAKLKYEFLAHYQSHHGVPLRSRLFGALDLTGKIGAIAPGLTNFLYANKAVRRLIDRLLKVDRRRPLPEVAAEGFSRWFQRRGPSATPLRGPVILWDDCHIRHHQPGLGRDAVAVLEAAGFQVHCVAGLRCCGRPMISKGLLDQARDHARHNVERLLPHALAGTPIIGIEPSCIACFRDEYTDLISSHAARVVAANSFFIEEFLWNHVVRYGIKLPFAPARQPQTVLAHTHCYQKALGTAEHVLKLLTLLPDTNVEEIACGCCGMAGAFGYEKEHYDISMAIGEQALFPAIRRSDADTLITAAGTSCRQQIADGTGRRAEHPISVIAKSLIR
jgi:FAD/FMN-containing dehydrogenase/Fe-S oxidoreductase